MPVKYRINIKRLIYILFKPKAVCNWVKSKMYRKFYKIKG